MSRSTLVILVLVGGLALTVPACGGGGGGGYRNAANPVLVTSTSMPSAHSGVVIDYPIQVEGGCGGPYDIQLISGALPPGVEVIDKDNYDDERYADLGFVRSEARLYGAPLADGPFDFRLQVTDTGCTPFSSATASYHLDVAVGEIVVVDVLLDGNASLLRAGDESYNPDYPALPKVVYNDFVALDFVVAGGVAPYSMAVYDDPGVPNDGNLPLGVSVPASSTSIVGAPVEVGPQGGPFLVSFEVTDAVGGKGYFTAYWFVDTPPIIVASEDLLDGECGQQYNDQCFVVEGVPPFNHDFVEMGLPDGYTSDKNPDPTDPGADVLYNPTSAPTVNPPQALVKIDAAVYPAASELGPDYATTAPGAPPEGIALDETTGRITGIPRRRGSFEVYYHVTSTLVPNSFGQHAWATFDFQMVPAGFFAQDAAYTLEGVFAASDPYSRIPDFEVGLPYNPDGGADGYQLLATGGVPEDGMTDAPHASQVAADPSETLGAYGWSVDWDPHSTGETPIPHVEFQARGVLRIAPGEEDDLVPQGFQDVGFTAADAALPLSLASTEARIVRISVGPDTVIITQSTTSFSGAASTSPDNGGMNDPNLNVKVLLPYSSGAVIRSLDDSMDLAGEGALQHTIPATAGSETELTDLLEGCDLLRAVVNPGGWWNDTMNFNPKGARSFMHGDANTSYGYRALHYQYFYKYQSGSYTSKSVYGANPETTAVRIPECTTSGVAEDRASGVYTSGGKLYFFDSTKYMGVFIVRKESKIYVPMAFDKTSSGYKSFGDTWSYKYSSTATEAASAFKNPNITVSPDGRFAAVKLSTSDQPSSSYYYYGDNANVTDIVIFSLTGERIAAWGGKTYKVIESGANGSTSSISSTGEKLFGASLTLTNSHLYYLCGNRGYTSSEYYSWRYHWIYRYDLTSGASAGSLVTSSDSQWANTAGYSGAMQVPWERYYRPAYTYSYTSGSYSRTYSYSYSDTMSKDGYNCYEGSKAPMPFRVNADGDLCVIIAARTTTSYGSSAAFSRHVWADDGTGPQRLSSTTRRVQGAARGTGLTQGPDTSYTYSWGSRMGPTTQVEIADDGSKVAVVVNRYSGYMYYYSSSEWGYYREDIIAYTPVNGGSDWSGGANEVQVTGSEGSGTALFGGSTLWHFGGLLFTKDNAGLVFWAGASGYSPTSTSSSYYYDSYTYYGSLYSYDFANDAVTHILAKSNGGANDSAGTRYPDDKSQVSYSPGSYYSGNRNLGAIKPISGFMEPNRNFYYIVTLSGLSSSYHEACRLIAINLRSLDDSSAINSHDDGRAFALGGSNWPSRRGFLPSYGSSSSYFYAARYGIYYGEYAPGGQFGSMQTMSDNGRVFFGAHWQLYGLVSPTTSGSYGGPNESTYHGCNGAFAGQVGFFDATVAGPVQLITTMSENLVSNNYSSTTGRTVKYLEARDDGSSVAFVYAPRTSTYWSYPINQGQERLGIVQNIETDATGAVTGEVEIDDIQGSAGRVSSSLTHDTSGSRVFYAYGTGNEKSKQIFVGEVSPSGSASTSALTGSGPTSLKRFNVLHAGR